MATRFLWIVITVGLYVHKTSSHNIMRGSFMTNILLGQFGLLGSIESMSFWKFYQNQQGFQSVDIDISDTEENEGKGWPYEKTKFTPRQSPIDVLTFKAVTKNLPVLNIIEPGYQNNVQAKLYNSGSTVYLKLLTQEAADLRPYIVGGPLTDKFIFEQMHLHWGTKDDWGSEHFMDGESFSAEIHLVYYNSSYLTYKLAGPKDGGLVVLTIFAEATDEVNPLLEPIHRLLPDVTLAKSSVLLDSDKAMQWVASALPLNSEYYTYPGSLTTKPYTENVVFIILPKPITLSHDQLNAFRGIENGQYIHVLENKRKLQPLNQRPIVRGTELNYYDM